MLEDRPIRFIMLTDRAPVRKWWPEYIDDVFLWWWLCSWVVFRSRTRKMGHWYYRLLISQQRILKEIYKCHMRIPVGSLLNSISHTTGTSRTFTLDYIPLKTKSISQIIVETNHFILNEGVNANSPLFLWIVECEGTIFGIRYFFLIARHKSVILPNSSYYKVIR